MASGLARVTKKLVPVPIFLFVACGGGNLLPEPRRGTLERRDLPPEVPRDGLAREADFELRTASTRYLADGDVFRTEDGYWVRLLGANAPEAERGDAPAEPGAAESRDALARKIFGKDLLLLLPPAQKAYDEHGRLWAVVLAGGDNVNLAMVEEGRAVFSEEGPTDLLDVAAFRSVEEAARIEKRGLWADPQGPIELRDETTP